MPGASLALFADLGACHVQKSSVTICVLPAPSGWRATPLLPPISMRWIYFYPRPPCGGRHITSFRIVFTDPISIHALRVEGDYHWDNHRRVRPDHFYPRPPGGGRQQKRTKFSSVFAQKGEEFASLRRGKRKICRWCFKKDKFWVLIWCEGSGKSVCASASHCG